MRLLYPDMYVPSLLEIKPDYLKIRGIKGILFDLDNTIVCRDSTTLPPEIKEFLLEFRNQGFKIAIVSNNSSKRVSLFGRILDAPSVHRALKPWVGPFRQGMRMIGTSPGETALVGDQIFTDIFGGNLAGLFTILVVPLQGKEFIGTRLISRRLEKYVLNKLKDHPEVFHGNWG